jgi:hypothetical protein
MSESHRLTPPPTGAPGPDYTDNGRVVLIPLKGGRKLYVYVPTQEATLAMWWPWFKWVLACDAELLEIYRSTYTVEPNEQGGWHATGRKLCKADGPWCSRAHI